jgi:peptidoglycan/LPS O-acetylase OafA/YrhL
LLHNKETHVTDAIAAAGFADSKRHYPILDGLRGVAALMVVAFHLFEAHAASRFVQVINHGYLAVDFFFVLSGFVIGYAYDDRWGTMTTADFFKRRLIRLHPMILAGMLVGAIMFYFGAGPTFPKIHDTPLWQVLLVLAIGITLLPVPAALDVRGWSEMHPLDGPAWSLFYEYVANILYALVVRRFSKGLLALCVLVFGCATIHYLVGGPTGDVIGGWSLDPAQVRIGLTRLLYPFFAGLLLSRTVKPGRIRHAFLLASLLVIAVLALPRFGDAHSLWKNGLYESLCIVLVFPLVVYLGASGTMGSGAGARVRAFLGKLSYPIYITHYAFIYVYTAWVQDHKIALREAWPVMLATYGASLLLAWLCMRFYDMPVRAWLTRRTMIRAARPTASEAARPAS